MWWDQRQVLADFMLKVEVSICCTNYLPSLSAKNKFSFVCMTSEVWHDAIEINRGRWEGSGLIHLHSPPSQLKQMYDWSHLSSRCPPHTHAHTQSKMRSMGDLYKKHLLILLFVNNLNNQCLCQVCAASVKDWISTSRTEWWCIWIWILFYSHGEVSTTGTQEVLFVHNLWWHQLLRKQPPSECSWQVPPYLARYSLSSPLSEWSEGLQGAFHVRLPLPSLCFLQMGPC